MMMKNLHQFGVTVARHKGTNSTAKSILDDKFKLNRLVDLSFGIY